MNEYQAIIKDLFGGMIKPKKHFISIKDRELSFKPLLIVLVILVGLTLISMMRIKQAAISLGNGELPLFVLENKEKFDIIISSTLLQMVVQTVYSLLVALLTSSIFLMIIVWLAKVDIDFKKCLTLICYSWGPNILAAAILSLLVLTLPIERTMFSQGLFEVVLGSSLKQLDFVSILDPFYIWSVIVLGRYLSNIPNNKNKTSWHYWAYAIYLGPIIMNVLYLIQLKQ